jgi:hypothetical protein
MDNEATYPTPAEIRTLLQESVRTSIDAVPVAAYIKQRYTWDGDGYDVVADAVVIWQRKESDWRVPEGRAWGWHSSVTIRSSADNGVSAPLAGGHYDMDSQSASHEASERARGWGWMDLRPGKEG